MIEKNAFLNEKSPIDAKNALKILVLELDDVRIEFCFR